VNTKLKGRTLNADENSSSMQSPAQLAPNCNEKIEKYTTDFFGIWQEKLII